MRISLCFSQGGRRVLHQTLRCLFAVRARRDLLPNLNALSAVTADAAVQEGCATAVWTQCGGEGFTGGCCPHGASCVEWSASFSQCVPAAVPSSSDAEASLMVDVTCKNTPREQCVEALATVERRAAPPSLDVSRIHPTTRLASLHAPTRIGHSVGGRASKETAVARLTRPAPTRPLTPLTPTLTPLTPTPTTLSHTHTTRLPHSHPRPSHAHPTHTHTHPTLTPPTSTPLTHHSPHAHPTLTPPTTTRTTHHHSHHF